LGFFRRERLRICEHLCGARAPGHAWSRPFAIGDRVFHQKFGNGDVVAIDGNKLTIAFDKAGEKRVVDSFVQRA
jgi:hypothetical protein